MGVPINYVPSQTKTNLSCILSPSETGRDETNYRNFNTSFMDTPYIRGKCGEKMGHKKTGKEQISIFYSGIFYEWHIFLYTASCIHPLMSWMSEEP